MNEIVHRMATNLREAASAKAGISIFGFQIFETPKTSLVLAMPG
jgi:hypothetical protein